MCFDDDSAPPVPVLGDAAVDSGLLELGSPDGNRFSAFGAKPSAPSEGAGPVGVLVLPDVRGLYRYYEELGLRFAERGHPALTIDYYGRTAGLGERGADFSSGEHVSALTPEGVFADLGAACDHLRSPAGGGCGHIVTIGFCLGGRISVLSSIGVAGIAGSIGFYCWPALGPDGAPGPTALAGMIKAPVLALMGGADPGIPPSDVEDFRKALAAGEVDGEVGHEVRVFPGAPHGFFDTKHRANSDAAAEAWTSVEAFIQLVGGQGAR